MIKITDIRQGSMVVMRGAFGNGVPTLVVVDEVLDDVKNGRPGIDYTIADGGTDGWAYLTQVDKVVKY